MRGGCRGRAPVESRVTLKQVSHLGLSTSGPDPSPRGGCPVHRSGYLAPSPSMSGARSPVMTPTHGSRHHKMSFGVSFPQLRTPVQKQPWTCCHAVSPLPMDLVLWERNLLHGQRGDRGQGVTHNPQGLVCYTEKPNLLLTECTAQKPKGTKLPSVGLRSEVCSQSLPSWWCVVAMATLLEGPLDGSGGLLLPKESGVWR